MLLLLESSNAMMTDQITSRASPVSAASSTPSSHDHSSIDGVNANSSVQSSSTSITTASVKSETADTDNPTIPALKADKPRPHVCGACARSFARLEHLKRHERSHTKEKPFECPECTRCFARRDLLLRHQQKLHLTGAPSGRAKASRRESTSGISTSSSKARKSSAANGTAGSSGKIGGGTVRPRANTISHIDAAGMFAGGQRMHSENGGTGYNLSHHLNMFNEQGNYHARINPTVHGQSQMLSEVSGLEPNIGRAFGLHTVPSEIAMDGLFDFDELSPGSTVNPAQLNLEESMESLESPFGEDFAWMRRPDLYSTYNINESAFDATSPSAVSTESPGGLENIGTMGQQTNGMVWSPDLNYHPGIAPFCTGAVDYNMTMGMMSSGGLENTNFDNHYPTPPPMSSLSPHMPMDGMQVNFQSQHMSIGPDQYQITDGIQHGIICSPAVGIVSEDVRQALIFSLAQSSNLGNGQREISQINRASPLSPDVTKSSNFTSSLPSRQDLQRYVNTYIRYFHPHFPFLHIPTLSFDSPAYSDQPQPTNYGAGYGEHRLVGGGGCLMLSMAAIGALYEFDRPASKDLFDAGKKLIQLYLEERRKADLAAASSTLRNPGRGAQNTPLWLVQAMLLNVIYGHNCGDKVSGDIASTHCTALVSLARAAGLVKPLPEAFGNTTHSAGQHDAPTGDNIKLEETWEGEGEQLQWYHWSAAEERKRTLFALFHMSSILTSAYHHAPAITNSEIELGLPCEEDLWAAESAAAWAAKGGAQEAKQRTIGFATALSMLLTASQTEVEQQNLASNRHFGSNISPAELPHSNLQPSAFGCLVLIDALHNYIWETRQRHSGRPWTTQETEAMYAHLEPALRAWQAAWAANPMHHIQRPNPFGAGPLSADSIPLLDLAYVRLFVNLGTSKEAFWQRDFDGMAEELAKGSDIITHAEYSESKSSISPGSASLRSLNIDGHMADVKGESTGEENMTFVDQQNRSSRRERHLRKAAFYAADSLSMSEKLGVTFADLTSRELPVQSALCTFDCAQVLAEWVASVQERVGRYLGVIGKTPVDFAQVPAILLLEHEDCKLLEKIQEILGKAEAKMTFDMAAMEMDPEAAMVTMNSMPSCSNAGYGSQILMVTAYMLQKAAVWPVTSLMAHGLQIQAAHMNHRAENSTIMTPN